MKPFKKETRKAFSVRKVFVIALAVLALFATTLAGTVSGAAQSTYTDGSVRIPGKAVIEKTVKEDCLTVKAYVTDYLINAAEVTPEPIDVVLVLDCSGSMSKNLPDGTTRMQAMKKAVCEFADTVASGYSAPTDHRISVVTFSGEASVLAGWTAADRNGVAGLKNKIEAIPERLLGFTEMSRALSLAERLIASRSGADAARKALVVLFSDGDPGSLDVIGDRFSTLFDTPDAADRAVLAASRLKKLGAEVFTVGFFDGADASAKYTTSRSTLLWTTWRSETAAKNGLMHFISGDYDMTCTSWRRYTVGNDGRSNGCYAAAQDAEALSSAFRRIAELYTAQGAALVPGADVVLREVISDDYRIDGEITVSTAPYNAKKRTFGKETPFRATVTVEGNVVSVKGFDYSAFACVSENREAKELIVRIPISDNSEKSGSVPVTAEGSGLYAGSGERIAASGTVSVDHAELQPVADRDAVKAYFDESGKPELFETVWETVGSLRKLGDNIYLIDYRYDYDIDDLMEKGVSSEDEYVSYLSEHLLQTDDHLKFGSPSGGCSVFAVRNEKGEPITGRNFDYSDSPVYLTWTHAKGGERYRYASIAATLGNYYTNDGEFAPESQMGSIQAFAAPYFVSDGINSEGFSISILEIHNIGVKQHTERPDIIKTAIMRICLDKAANVEEAIELFRQFDMQDPDPYTPLYGLSYHYFLTDASGDAALIEYVNGRMRVIRKQDVGVNWLCATNFYLSPDGGIGSLAYVPSGIDRYLYLTREIERKSGKLTFADSFRLLSDVQLDEYELFFGRVITDWTSVYNNREKILSLATKTDYHRIYTFSFDRPLRVLRTDDLNLF